MPVLFIFQVFLFASVAIVVANLPKPFRARYFYSYLAVILLFGGLLGNAYAVEVAGGITVGGTALVKGAFMLTAVLFVLVERDVFVLRRLIFLVVSVLTFTMFLSAVMSMTLQAGGTFNRYDLPPAVFAADTPLIVLIGIMLVLELAVLLWLFEQIKRVSTSSVVVATGFTLGFVAVVLLDGLLAPILTGEIRGQPTSAAAGRAVGSYVVVSLAYGLALLVFFILFPARLTAYVHERVFTWPTLLSSSQRIIRELSEKEQQLTQSEGRILQSAILAGLGYAVSNATTGKVEECDRTYAEMHGLTPEQLTGLDIVRDVIEGMVHPDDLDSARAAHDRLLAGETVVTELRHLRPDGAVRSLRKVYSPLPQETGGAFRYQVVGQDVTDTRQLQDSLQQSQKMDAIGKLTGGMAHDFNNLLAVILGNLELLDEEVTDPDHKELIRNSVTATMRGADLTRNLLSFARKAPLRPKVVDMNALVEDLQSWTQRTLPSTITVRTRLEPALWKTRVDPTSAESGLLNLILNARDAMPSGGTLTIETANVMLRPDDPALEGADAAPGRYVLLQVRDTGEGIAAANLAKVFDPFFTTKPVGAGSGLGLSMVSGFMQQSKGLVRVASTPQEGTTISLYFRVAEDEVPTAAPDPGVDLQAQDRHILLVEDDRQVLATMRSILTRQGFRVSTATTGDEALALVPRIDRIDLLLTDIVMPGMLQGGDLVAALKRDRPDLPVVMMSGYFDAGSGTGPRADATGAHLVKPVKRQELLRAVAQALSPVPPAQGTG
ncbi:response regulator [Thalassorhabdomicrobium marinisediminis]|uniref:histidine kinase n=1 Tax=Thalassorhabdomicrobium marinisediminis TaxID=2170577 RepID=A0A2T7FWX3_9RHOB|nr:response regulator [Thalassorhabdomicrobium marinisediminis]PVA06666.1 hypothetical protein DC363_09045 [Thalassorhabdomicrobium marinisediminis]